MVEMIREVEVKPEDVGFDLFLADMVQTMIKRGEITRQDAFDVINAWNSEWWDEVVRDYMNDPTL